MAVSKCLRCGNSSFEMTDARISGSDFSYNFVQCASCGSVVGAVEAYYNAELIRQLAKKLGVEVR